jgi:hypothetical protein
MEEDLEFDEDWVDRERRTSRLIRACYQAYWPKKGLPSADLVYSLCQLTWITKGMTEWGHDVTDNTAAVVAPALSRLVGVDLKAETHQDLSRALRMAKAPGAIVKLAAHPIGIVNFYAGFRRIAYRWVKRHLKEIAPLLRTVSEATRRADLHATYAALDKLRSLPRPRGGNGSPSSLLTPVLACLHAPGRAPIINGRKVWLLKKLGLASSSLEEQYDGLVGLIGQAGMSDAFDLDVAGEDEIDKAMKKRPKATKNPRKPTNGSEKPTKPSKPLSERNDEDLVYLRSVDTVKMGRLHNKMTNSLRRICNNAGLAVEEGSEKTCLYDALIRAYRGSERHLLVEVKTDDAQPLCRMAVGQLHDYRRQLGDRAAIDLGVLLPGKPTKDALSFFEYVGVQVMWFNPNMTKVAGDVRLGGRMR